MGTSNFYIAFAALGVEYAIALEGLEKIVTKGAGATKEGSVYTSTTAEGFEFFDGRPEAERQGETYTYVMELRRQNGTCFGLAVTRVTEVIENPLRLKVSPRLQSLAKPYWRGIIKDQATGNTYNLVDVEGLYDYLSRLR